MPDEQRNSLALIAHGATMLAEARTLSDVKNVLDLAVAAKRYAEAKHLGEEAVRYAQEIVLRATRRMGEMLPPVLDRGGDRRSAEFSKAREDFEIPQSISEKQRKVAQQIATLPEVKFERFMTAGRELTQKRALRLAREHKVEEKRTEPIAISAPGAPDIRHGDFVDVLRNIEPSSVDAIITDPPYPREYIPLFGSLGELAARLLKPSGVLAVMCGQTYLFEYLGLLGAHVAYRWTAAYLTAGPALRQYDARVGTGWKPVLLYQRRDANAIPFLVRDIFVGGGDDKRFHHWGQSESGIAQIVERLSVPGALVVDPFLGGGTTAVVCRDLERRFIGCDIDAAAVNETQERLRRS